MSENPYAATRTRLKQDNLPPPEIVLASRFKRLVARIVDWMVEDLFFLLCVFLIPGLWDTYKEPATRAISELESSDSTFWSEYFSLSFSAEAVAFWIFGIGITFLFQAYLLARYGQTIGKRMMKIKIVSDKSYLKPSLTRSFVVRECGIHLLEWIPILPLLDILWIFGQPRRCLHDLWAGTIVIDTLD